MVTSADHTTALRAPLSLKPILFFAAALLLFAGYWLWVWSQTLVPSWAQIEREHGVVVPSSASNLICEGSGGWPLDRTVTSTFEIPPADLVKFIGQLKPDVRTGYPWPFTYGDGVSRYYCDSPTGDGLLVSVTQIDSTLVRVTVSTDWN